jgi:hypothetical protein
VPLVFWDTVSRSIKVEFLEVPAPPPFESGDIQSMWKELLDFPLHLITSVAMQGRGTGSATTAGQPLASEALPRAISGCRRLLRRWPSKETRETIWRPADMQGGREDLRATDRAGARQGGVKLGRKVIPDRVARRQRGSIPWTSPRLAGACRTLATYLEQARLDGSERVLVTPLKLVSQCAAPAQAVPDPPLSSWPGNARTTFRAVIEALVGLAVADRGGLHVPLSDVWRIYENWIALRVLLVLEKRFGPVDPVGEGAVWSAEWNFDGIVVRLHSQREIGAPSDDKTAGHPDGLISVSSDLQPDVLISVTSADGDQALFCVDAKRRIAATEMDAGDVATAASKYIWGIRMADDPDVLPVETTLIVSSAGLAAVHDVERSRIFGLFALPSQGTEDFDSFIDEELKRLIMEVAAP